MKSRLLAALAFLAMFLAIWFSWPGDLVEVAIPSGSTATQAASLLKKEGVVRSAWLFRAAARVAGIDRRLKPGAYRFYAHMPLWQLIPLLGSGSPEDRVLIPEGFATWQIAERLQATHICPAADFRQFVAEHRFEGYLFPTTYALTPAPASHIAERMRREFALHIEAEFRRTSPKPSFTLHQLLTLASIVEREAARKAEGPLIAAVYFNRLKKRMRLEADPTVQYALGSWKKGLTLEDLHVNSSYNTYVHYGLPPGPICNPGLEAFKAVLHPAQTEAIYFVADNSGGHAFSTNLEDHLRAKRALKKLLREQRLRQAK
jgi:UPF0755 protein